MKLLFSIFILLLPTQLAYHFWPDFAFVYGVRVDYFSPTIYATELLWLLIFALWIIKDKSAVRKILSKWRALVVLLVLAIVNIFFSSIPEVCAFKWLRVGEFLSLYFFIKNQKDIVQSIKVPLVVSLFLTLLLAITQIIKGGSLGGILYWLGERSFSLNTPGIALFNFFGTEMLRPYATFGHPNVLAGFALLALFLFIKKRGFLARTIVLPSLILIVISVSQNAWLALFLTPVVYIFSKKIKDGLAKFVRLAAVASLFLTLPITTHASREIIERMELNQIAGNIISQRPVFGIGLGDFVSQLPFASSLRSIWFLQPVHNIFLLVAAETGLVGLLFFVYFLGKNTNAKNALPVIAIVLTGLFDHYWISGFQTMMLAAIVLAIGYNKR